VAQIARIKAQGMKKMGEAPQFRQPFSRRSVRKKQSKKVAACMHG
jgi:hypothetical protein